MKKLFTLFVTLLLVSPAAHAMQKEATPVGADIPSIQAMDHNNQKQDFQKLTGEKGAVFIFFRSVDWCPFCQKQLKEFEKHRNSFQSKGYNLVGISYDSVESLNKFAQKNKIAYELLSDENSKIIKDFGLLNTQVSEGSKAYGTPNPAVYVIGADKKVTHIFTEEGYKKRPEISAVLEALK